MTLSACSCHSSNGNNGSGSQGSSLIRHINEFVGETVTIFTTSGGASGCGFTGVILSLNSCFVRLVTDLGVGPSNPLAENICGDMDNGNGPRSGSGNSGNSGRGNCNGNRNPSNRAVGSVVDIPIDRIAAFCHNAV